MAKKQIISITIDPDYDTELEKLMQKIDRSKSWIINDALSRYFRIFKD